jgi:hypothetical protein
MARVARRLGKLKGAASRKRGRKPKRMGQSRVIVTLNSFQGPSLHLWRTSQEWMLKQVQHDGG